MAEKEERILIARSMDYTLTDTDKGTRFDGKIAPHCANVMTRQEAVLLIARTLKGCTSGDCFEEAEYVLDALLEGKI